MTTQNAIVVGNTDRSLDRRKCLNFFFIQSLGVAKQVDLGEALFGALYLVYANGYTGKILQKVQSLAIGIALHGGVWM